MNKQHLADMLKNIANGDEEAAKLNFSAYATEKSIELLNPEPPAVEVPEPVEPPTEDDTTSK